jgi:energy-coupling factor transporter ATP-binding protein EcfA2
MSSEPDIVVAHELTRRFTSRTGRLRRERRDTVAVDAVSFTVHPGETVGYIGANGAGKSTTIKMLTGILVPSSGTVRTCGMDPVARRASSPAASASSSASAPSCGGTSHWGTRYACSRRSTSCRTGRGSGAPPSSPSGWSSNRSSTGPCAG